MDTPVLVQVDHLMRYYGARCAVNDLSFTLHQGQVLGFLGPNGAGKTTTLQLLAGCLAPDAGRILILGHDLRQQPLRAKAGLGYLPEQPPLYPELTVDEYLTYCARLHHLPRGRLATAVAKTKARCELETVGKRLLGHLSRGYRQRVGLAQAIIHEPAVIILDEPAAGLDPVQQHELAGLIGELGREQGVILSTHSLAEVQSVCTHVQIIQQGRLVYSSSLIALKQQSSHSLLVGFSVAPMLETLVALPAVDQVETLGEQRFRLHYTPPADPVPTLLAQALAQGWGLRELTPERGSLERRFIELLLGKQETT
ncbi:MAG TPA: ATP-binding cassette domain-containing protein [Candidatus Competibacteraceae bacterium]|nr:ATP-binding cassette domain-containing protein [Candidatus Competibacteraceae bacterium]